MAIAEDGSVVPDDFWDARPAPRPGVIGATVERAVASTPTPSVLPGTVTEWDLATYTAKVRFDDEDADVGAEMVGRIAPQPGQRVLVLLAPPHGAWVLGYIRTTVAGEPPLPTEFIPTAIVEALGDLIAGDAEGDPVRHPVGANDLVLAGDSAAPTGLAWVAALLHKFVDAKGDLAVGSADNVFSRLARPATPGLVLTVDHSLSTLGLHYTDPVVNHVHVPEAPLRIALTVRKATSQSISHNPATHETILFDTIVEQELAAALTLNTSTGVVTCNVGGWYLLPHAARFSIGEQGRRCIHLMHTPIATGVAKRLTHPTAIYGLAPPASDWTNCDGCALALLAPGDTILLDAYQNNALSTSLSVLAEDADSPRLSFVYQGAPHPVPFLTAHGDMGDRNDYAGYVGFKFTMGARSRVVSHLGRMVSDGNTQAHTVKIVRLSDGVVIATVGVETAGRKPQTHSYAAIGPPQLLVAGTAYALLSSEVLGGDYWGELASVTGTPAIATITNDALQPGGVGAVSHTVATSSAYGPPDMKFL